jgi:hypothetical protein
VRKLSAFLTAVALMAAMSLVDAQSSLTLTFGPGRDATQDGIARLAPFGKQTRVTIDMAPAGPSQPAHIHAGRCPSVGAIKYPLTNIANGKSETLVNTTLAELRSTQYAINVHRQPTEPSVYTACVNIPAAE